MLPTAIAVQNINRSLSSLGDVIAALQQRSKHVPFRNSKLTYLLEDVFTGDSKVMMLAMVAPGLACGQESMCTLSFAERAAAVNLRSSRVHSHPVDVVQRLRTKCRALEAEVSELRRQLTLSCAGVIAVVPAVGGGEDATSSSSISSSDGACTSVEPRALTSNVTLPADVQRLVACIKGMASSAVEASVAERRVAVDVRPALAGEARAARRESAIASKENAAGDRYGVTALASSKTHTSAGSRERRLSTGSAESGTSASASNRL